MRNKLDMFDYKLLLTTGDVSSILGVSISTLKRWRREGKGPRWVRIGKRAVRYRLGDVFDFEEGLSSERCEYGSLCSCSLLREVARIARVVKLECRRDSPDDPEVWTCRIRSYDGRSAISAGPTPSAAVYSVLQSWHEK